MRTFRLIQCVAAVLAVVGMVCPQAAIAQQVQPAKTIDVQLRQGNALSGQVMNLENTPVANSLVALHQGEQLLAVGRTDAQGVFSFQGLQAGVYQVSTDYGQGIYRVWTEGSAPPTAQNDVVIRGQHSGMRNVLASPLLWIGVIAAAVAIPVAIHNSDRDPASP